MLLKKNYFSAYFTEGKDFGDHETLISIGKEIGLKEEEIKEALMSDVYAEKVEHDIQEAADIGVQGVPFFVFDRKYAVSGAQPPESFSAGDESVVRGMEKRYSSCGGGRRRLQAGRRLHIIK